MAVRNCADLGPNLKKIVLRLMANDNLVNLLYYTDATPLEQPPLTEEQKRKEIFNKLIKIIPKAGPKETARSLIAIRIANGSQDLTNTEFKRVTFIIEIFVPLDQWLIKGDNLRPFSIMGEIQKSLDGITINGLGKMTGGDFELYYVTEELSVYSQAFTLISYD